MVNVDISNVWAAVSLPELLGREKEVFDAHQKLVNHQLGGPDFLGWLSRPDSIQARLIHGIRRASDQILADSEVLVVCGACCTAAAAKAAIEAYHGCARNLLHTPQIFFVGGSLSSRQWLELSQLLEDRSYSLLLVSPTGSDLGTNVTARGLRWLMERKYGAAAKNHIFVATPVGTPLHRCGQEEGYELFPMPRELGGTASIFTAGALLPMSAAGIDPLAVLDGAVETAQAMDIRAFENPAWLYAAARAVLAGKGYGREFLCFFDHSLDALGRWWQQLTWQWQTGRSRALTPVTALLPGDLGVLDNLAASGQAQMLETLVHFAPIAKKVPVEMDWKDYDGLGFLSGRNWEDVEQALAGALNETHSMAGVPLVDVDAGDLTAESLGSLFYFLELSSALTACLAGEEPFPPDGAKVQRCAMAQLRGENT